MKQCLKTSQILKSVDFTKTQKLNILRTKKTFFLHIKGYFISKNSFVAEVTFNTRNRELNIQNTL